jgi:hypothetical protein
MRGVSSARWFVRWLPGLGLRKKVGDGLTGDRFVHVYRFRGAQLISNLRTFREKDKGGSLKISTYPQDCAILLSMAIEGIIAQLDAEIARLKEVRTLLSATGKVEAKISAAEIKTTKKTKVTKAAKVAPKAKSVKRVLSPEARKAIADAQRKRWAAQKANA